MIICVEEEQKIMSDKGLFKQVISSFEKLNKLQQAFELKDSLGLFRNWSKLSNDRSIKKLTNINMEESMPPCQILNPCIPRLVKG